MNCYKNKSNPFKSGHLWKEREVSQFGYEHIFDTEIATIRESMENPIAQEFHLQVYILYSSRNTGFMSKHFWLSPLSNPLHVDTHVYLLESSPSYASQPLNLPRAKKEQDSILDEQVSMHPTQSN